MVVQLHAYLQQTFAQCKIFLEGTLLRSKMAQFRMLLSKILKCLKPVAYRCILAPTAKFKCAAFS